MSEGGTKTYKQKLQELIDSFDSTESVMFAERMIKIFHQTATHIKENPENWESFKVADPNLYIQIYEKILEKFNQDGY